MKTNRILLSITLFAAANCGSLHSASIVSGSLSLDYDQTTFGFLGLTNINSFGQTVSNTRTAAQIQADAGTSTSWTGIGYGINPTTPLTDPTGRDLQETNFTYNPANLTGTAAGAIGIGGTTRWDIDPFLGGGVFILGDFTARYDAARAGGIYSGWYLTNHFSFPSVAFDLANVSTNVLGDGFTLTGDLYVKTGEPLNAFFGFPGETDYGNFSLSASTIPEPSSAMLGALPLLSLLSRRRRNG
jgi:uncharacterized protein (TIGR03382 family)